MRLPFNVHGVQKYFRGKWHQYRTREKPKRPIVERSLLAASLACLIHIPSLAVAGVLLWLNFGGFYIGSHLRLSNSDNGDNVVLAVIQVAAKIEEILVILSTGAVVFHVVKLRLIGQGIPYGWAAAGFSFMNPRYLVSRALWGGLTSTSSIRFRGLQIFALILFGSFLTLATGPASAVLMLPRITTTHSFDTKFWFNGSATDYWPTKLTDEHIGGPNCLKRNGANCVSEGFKLFEGYYTYARNQVDYQVQTEEPLNPRIIQAYLRGSGSAETWSLAPHAPTSFLANEMWNDPHWYPRTTHATGQRSMHIDAQMSVVRTVCTRQFQEFPNTTIELSLPMLAEYTTWATEDSQGPYTNVRLPKPLWSLNTASLVNDSNIAVAWIPTTANLTSMTTGIVILGALNSTHSTKRLGLTCSIDARWNNASHTVTETTTYLRQVEKQGNPVNATLGGSCPIDTLHKAALPVDHRYWRTITAESSFLEALNAKPNPKSSKADTTSITSVLQAANMDPSKAFKPAQPQLSASIKRYETVIATVFADAISRIGLEKVSPHESATIFTSSPEADCHFITKYSRLRFCPKPPTGSYTPLTMKAFLKGYAFEASRVTDYLAIGVMIIYTSLALAHIVCLLAFRRTCACWDTIEEVIALALTSKARGKGIGEMAVGVRRTETMGLMARVRRVKVGDEELGTEAGKVQLLLDDRGADAQVEVKKHVDHGNSGNKGATKGSRDREIAQQKNRRAMSYPTPPTKFIESSTANGRNSC